MYIINYSHIESTFNNACSDCFNQEEKLKLFNDVIEQENEYLKTKI